MNKRSFLQHTLALGIAGFAPRISMGEWLQRHESRSAETLSDDEEFWGGIRAAYKLKREYINLENGYYCFLPEETLNKYIDHIRDVNFEGSYYMRTVQADNKQKVTAAVSNMAGCSPAEIMLTRNTTESLDTVINGVHWNAGDEAIMAEQDYGSIVSQFKLMAQRFNIVPKILSIPNHPASDEEIVDLYRKAITPKTKLMLVSHMINITGQILPIKKICDMAHSLNVEVAVDGAHTFGHLKFKISDLGCDYYAASLHKWLSVPLGAGILYVKEGKAPGLFAMMADTTMKDDITHLAHTGTHPVATDLTILDAIDFYNKLGPERKEARLRYLQTYWTSRVRNEKNVVVNTPSDPARACGIANVGIKTLSPADMAKTLLDKYKIWTVAIDSKGVQGCRITPNVYTTTAELDVFVKALIEMGKG
jgi:selenocysteine lyase/cysteine desulfurase